MSSLFGLVSSAMSFLSYSSSSEEPILPAAPPTKIDENVDLESRLSASGFKMTTINKKKHRTVLIHYQSKLIRKIIYQQEEIVLWECYEDELLHGPCFVKGVVAYYRQGEIVENPVRVNIQTETLNDLEVFKYLYRYCFIDSSFVDQVSSSLSLDVTSWNTEVIRVCEPTVENPSNLLLWYDLCA